MKKILEGLQKPLSAEDIDFRIGAAGINKSGKAWATVLAYKDARVDMRRLDEVTDGLWQNEYHRDSKGVLQCSISIYNKDLNVWVAKTSNGTESMSEAVKGEYSDAFKRAGFMWGIGRELYDMGEIFISLNNGEYKDLGNGKAKCFLNLRKWSFSLVGKNIVAKDTNGKERFKVLYGSTRIQGDIEVNPVEAPSEAPSEKSDDKAKKPTAAERVSNMKKAINNTTTKESFDKMVAGVMKSLDSDPVFTDKHKASVNKVIEDKKKTIKG